MQGLCWQPLFRNLPDKGALAEQWSTSSPCLSGPRLILLLALCSPCVPGPTVLLVVGRVPSFFAFLPALKTCGTVLCPAVPCKSLQGCVGQGAGSSLNSGALLQAEVVFCVLCSREVCPREKALPPSWLPGSRLGHF